MACCLSHIVAKKDDTADQPVYKLPLLGNTYEQLPRLTNPIYENLDRECFLNT